MDFIWKSVTDLRCIFFIIWCSSDVFIDSPHLSCLCLCVFASWQVLHVRHRSGCVQEAGFGTVCCFQRHSWVPGRRGTTAAQGLRFLWHVYLPPQQPVILNVTAKQLQPVECPNVLAINNLFCLIQHELG